MAHKKPLLPAGIFLYNDDVKRTIFHHPFNKKLYIVDKKHDTLFNILYSTPVWIVLLVIILSFYSDSVLTITLIAVGAFLLFNIIFLFIFIPLLDIAENYQLPAKKKIVDTLKDDYSYTRLFGLIGLCAFLCTSLTISLLTGDYDIGLKVIYTIVDLLGLIAALFIIVAIIKKKKQNITINNDNIEE